MTDHDAIAARVRNFLTTGQIFGIREVMSAYLDLYDDRARIAAEWAEASQRNYQRAKSAEAERDRLLAALDDIAAAAFWIANEIHIGPDDEGREIYEMVQAIRDDARAALKGDSDE